MATAILTVAEVFVSRLRAAPSIGITNIRRTHLTPVTREDAPAIQVRADRTRRGGGKRANCVERIMVVRVAIIVRSDNALDMLDPLLELVAERLDPATPGFAAYGRGIVVDLDTVDLDDDIADQDALRCNLDYTVSFFTPENLLTVV